ncbi:hypothetical protein E4U36_000212, partial [Claviceps purpurea]
MAFDFSDPEAVRLYFEERQASLLLQIKEKDERDRKRRRLVTSSELTSLELEIQRLKREKEQLKGETEQLKRETEQLKRETEQLKQETEQLKRETEQLKRETEGSSLLKYMKISQKTFRTKLVVEENPKRRTKGAAVTKIDGKVYPHKVKPWKGFLDKQR